MPRLDLENPALYFHAPIRIYDVIRHGITTFTYLFNLQIPNTAAKFSCLGVKSTDATLTEMSSDYSAPLRRFVHSAV